MFRLLCLYGFFLLFAQPVQAQPDARTFQNFFRDGTLVGKVYGDAGLGFSNFPVSRYVAVGGQIGIPIGAAFELGAGLNFLSRNPDNGDNTSGVSDLALTGRYRISRGQTSLSIGGGITLPIGDEDINENNVDVQIFGALRHSPNADLALTSVFGIDFLEQPDNNHDTYLRLGGGAIYQSTPRLQVVSELSVLAGADYALVSLGVDYLMNSGTRLRPGFALGLDNRTPDFIIMLRFLFL